MKILIPKHLVGDPPEITRILHLLGRTRDHRRQVRDKLRRRYSKLTQTAADNFYAETEIDPRIRPARFWKQIAELRMSQGHSPNRLMGLDLFLLLAFEGNGPATQRWRDLFPSLDAESADVEEFRELVRKSNVFHEERDLVVLALWPAVVARLQRWDELSEPDRQSVCGAVCAFESITRGGSCYAKAIEIEPRVSEHFIAIELEDGAETDEAEQRADMKDDRRTARADEEIMDARVAWGRAWQAVSDLAVRAAACDPTEESLRGLEEQAAKVREALEQFNSNIARPVDVRKSKLADLLRQTAEAPLVESFGADFAEAIVAGWEREAALATGADHQQFIARLAEAEEGVGRLLEECLEIVRLKAEDEQTLRAVDDEIAAATGNIGKRLALKTKQAEAQERCGVTSHRLASVVQRVAEVADVCEEARKAALASTPTPLPPSTLVPTESALPAPPPEMVALLPPSPSPQPASAPAPASPPVHNEAPVDAKRDPPPVPAAPAPAPVATSREPSAEGEPGFNDEAGRVCAPIWAALAHHQPALAYHLAQMLKSTRGGWLTVPPPEIMRAAALADFVQSADGPIARELTQAYAEMRRESFDEGPLEWKTALGLLLTAATLKPSLLASATGAPAILKSAHVGDKFRALYRLRDNVCSVAEHLQGQSLTMSSFGGARSQAAWTQVYEGFAQRLAEWRKRAPYLTIKFAPATMVWQKWQQPSAPMGVMLDTLVREPSPAQVAKVREAVARISNISEFRDMVRATDRQELARRRGEDIHAGALNQLHARALEAIAFATEWLEHVGARPDTHGYVSDQLDRLQQVLSSLAPEISRELDDAIQHSDDPWSRIRSAAVVVKSSIRNLLQLFSPDSAIREPEVDPRLIIAAPLLMTPSLAVSSDWILDESAARALEQLLPVAHADPSWEKAFDERLARGDVETAEMLCRVVAEVYGVDAEPLLKQARQKTAMLRDTLMRRRKEAERGLESAMSFGYIADAERAEFQARIAEAAQEVEQVRRFDLALVELETVRNDISAKKAARIGEAQAQADALGLQLGSPEELRVRQALTRGDVVTANEYIHRLSSKEPLPEPVAVERDYFADFFPSALQAIEQEVEELGAGKAAQVANIVRNGGVLGGRDLSTVEGVQRRTAAEMLDTWFRLKRTQKFDLNEMQKLLAGVGFSNVRLDRRVETGDKTEFMLSSEPIADRSVCPVPTFGSRAEGRYRGVAVWKIPSEEDLVRIVGDGAVGRPTIVLYFGRLREKQRRVMARQAREKSKCFLVLDEVLLLYLATEPKSRLAAFFHCAVPFTHVEPFGTASSLVPPETFFGRRNELNAILDPTGSCFIYGGRQLGKTALLRHAERRANSPEEACYAKWVDLKGEHIGYAREPSEIWNVMYQHITAMSLFAAGDVPSPSQRRGGVDAFIEGVKAALGSHRGIRLLLLLDEADRFLEQDSRDGFPETTRLKNLMEATDRRVKVVFAGLHNVLRTTTQANHPLAHFGNPIEIGPLLKGTEWQEARALIVQPMAAAGYVFANEELPIRILAQTNYYPSLIQLYCEQLMRELLGGLTPFDYQSGPRYAITEQLVEDAYQAHELREAIRSKFKLTLQLDPRYELIAYAIAYAAVQKEMSLADGASAKEVMRRAKEWWPEGFAGVGDHEFRGLLDEMVGLGVLRRTPSGFYSLRNPNVLLLMGTPDEISDVLLQEREKAPEFAPSLYRAADPSSPRNPRRSPLTFSQEGDLLQRRNGVSIIAGTGAAGLADLVPFLKLRLSHSQLQILEGVVDVGRFEKRLDQLEARAAGATTVVIVPSDTPWNKNWVDIALAKVGRLKSEDRPVRIAFVGDSLALWRLSEDREELTNRGISIVTLRCWSDDFFRQWLSDIGVTGVDAATRQQIAQCTGLWPSVLYDIAETTPNLHSASLFLTAARSKIADSTYRKKLLSDLGLGPGEYHHAIQLASELDGSPLEDLKSFSGEVGIDPDHLRGLLESAELLDIARPLGAEVWSVSPFVKGLLVAEE